MRILLLLLASLTIAAGCTAANPDYGQVRELSVAVDLAVANDDSATGPPVDLVCGLPCTPDLEGHRDMAVPDLATEDLVPPPDLAPLPDLYGVDLGPPCGHAMEPCCLRSSCLKNAYCLNGTCAACGILGQACCLGNMCDDGSVCENAACVPCGAVGEPCCAGNTCLAKACCDTQKKTCVAANANCARGDRCEDGKCAGCGVAGLPCCANNTCHTGCCDGASCVANNEPCGPGMLCDNNACNKSNACGLLGNACCMGGVCLQGQGLCDPGKKLCTTCGGPGQPCCNNTDCYSGGCCQNNLCLRSGRACGMGRICDDGVCSPCGGPAERCCEASTCNGEACCGLNRTCVTPNSSCGNNCAQMQGRPPVCGTCMANECVGGNFGQVCGGRGQTCCVTIDATPNFCSAPGTTCFGPGLPNPGTCVTCGGDKQACCAGNRCDAGGCCFDNVCHASGASCGPSQCQKGSCGEGTCGSLGQACCPGSRCTGPDVICASERCVPCGGLDERCCIDGSSQLPLWCAPPYHPTGVRFQGQMLVGTCLCG